jgi:hypothetical protein
MWSWFLDAMDDGGWTIARWLIRMFTDWEE